ncbi:MAG: excisionase family DNA-binding protein [Treponema sp.]|nr:excisionase family DNA-binding protein [Treponema sp.]
MDNLLQTQEAQIVAPRFLSISQVVKFTSLSRSTICRHIKNRRIPHVKMGTRVLVAVSFLDELKKKLEARA